MRIRISLPDDRDFAGRLEVLDASGTVVFGPVPAAGRAHDETAAAHGNASRNPLLPYGDTPLGTFAVRGVVESGSRTGFNAEVLGWHGVLLEPVSGQAALADAHGRLRLLIQGGGECDGRLRATAGAIQLHDQDQRQLVALVRQASGRVLCEVIATAERGARVSLVAPPLDSDPPALPGRSYVSTRPSAKRLSDAVRSFAVGYTPRMFVVVPERSGSGGTTYGDGGGGGGGFGGDTGVGDTGTSIGPFPDTGVDVAPTPGGDLNSPPDDTGVTIAESGGSQLLSTAPQTGLSDPYSPEQSGWLTGQQPADPYSNVPATDNGLASFTGNDTNTFTGNLPAVDDPNWYTGTASVDPSTNTSADGGATPVDTTQGTYYSAPQRDTVNDPDASIQEMVQRFAQYDADLRSSQAAQQPSDSTPPPDLNTSPAPTPDQNYTPATSPGQNFSSASSPPDLSISQTYTPGGLDPTTVIPTSPPDDILPWTPAGSAGALSSQAYIAPFDSQGVPSFSRPLGTGPQPNQWRGYLGETSFEANSLFGGSLLTDLNARPFTTASGAPGNPGFFPVLDYQNVVTGNPTSVATSVQGNLGTPGDQSRLDFYRSKYGELIGSRNAQKLNTASQNLGMNPNEVAERGSLAVNSDDVRAARDFISQDIRNNPGNYPPGWDPNAPYRQIVGQGLTTPQLSSLQQARAGLGNLSAGDIQRLTSPEALGVARNGWGGALGGSALRGGGFGAGIATGIDAASILLNPDAHPDAVRELATTGVLGAGSGATGSVTEAAFNARFSQSLLSAAASGEEVGLLTPLLGRVAGGGIGGGLAAPVFTLGQLALSDQQYTAVDYEAKGVRSAAAGIYSGALAAGVVGAIWGTEVPILGNIVGFAVGFGGYLLYDAVFGEDIENAVRHQ